MNVSIVSKECPKDVQGCFKNVLTVSQGYFKDRNSLQCFQKFSEEIVIKFIQKCFKNISENFQIPSWQPFKNVSEIF